MQHTLTLLAVKASIDYSLFPTPCLSLLAFSNRLQNEKLPPSTTFHTQHSQYQTHAPKLNWEKTELMIYLDFFIIFFKGKGKEVFIDFLLCALLTLPVSILQMRRLTQLKDTWNLNLIISTPKSRLQYYVLSEFYIIITT